MILGLLGILLLVCAIFCCIKSKGKNRIFACSLFFIAVIAALAGGVLFVYNRVQIADLKNDYEVEGTDLFSSYSVIAEDDIYYVVHYGGFMDRADFAVPKSDLQDNKGSFVGENVLLCYENGSYIGIPVESQKKNVCGVECYPISNVKMLIKDYAYNSIGLITVSVLVLLLDIIVTGILIIVNGIRKRN